MSLDLRALPLRTVLRLDGLLCLGMGAGLVVLRHPLAGFSGLSPTFLAIAGGLLIPVGLFILAVASFRTPPRAGVMVVVVGNVLWVVASMAVLVAGIVSPTALGAALILVQALVVAGLAALEAAPRGAFQQLDV